MKNTEVYDVEESLRGEGFKFSGEEELRHGHLLRWYARSEEVVASLDDMIVVGGEPVWGKVVRRIRVAVSISPGRKMIERRDVEYLPVPGETRRGPRRTIDAMIFSSGN